MYRICAALLAIILTSSLQLNAQSKALNIDNKGRVGIGVLAPAYLLDVADRIRIQSGPAGSAGVWLTPPDNQGLVWFIGLRDGNTLGVWNSSLNDYCVFITGNDNSLHVGGSVLSASVSTSGNINAGNRVLDKTGYVTPTGGIIMFSGSLGLFDPNTGEGLPGQDMQGWALCDGKSGRPDLRDRFVMGAGNTPALTYGGTNSQTLTIDQMPVHSHEFGVGGGSGSNRAGSNQGNPNGNCYSKVSTATEGGGKPFDNRPAYVALFYIIKL